jgi:1-acyl-sn-glycerol-3-phosphate acyltransferase
MPRELVYPPVIRTVLGFYRALDCQITVEGQEHLPGDTGGGVLAINHIGYLDFTFAGYPVWKNNRRLVRFLAKKELFDKAGVGSLLRGMRHIAVDRDAGAGSYALAVEKLKSGELIGMFPEATISRSFCLKDFKNGAARMAAEAGVPLYPVVVWGTQRILTKGRPRNWQRHLPITVAVGEPLHPKADDDITAVTAELKARMTELLEKAQSGYPDAPKGDSDRWWLPARLGGTAPTQEAAREMEQADVIARREKRRANAAGKKPGKS